MSEHLDANESLMEDEQQLQEQNDSLLVAEDEKVLEEDDSLFVEEDEEAFEEDVKSVEEDDNKKWYVVHTYSGYENKVKANIESIVENLKLGDMISEIIVPMHKVLEEKNGVRKETDKKRYPGYVLIKMVMTDDTWYVVRNTRGVTGFVGPGSKPVPLTDQEIKVLGIDLELFEIDVKVGDYVRVIAGPLEDHTGYVIKIDESKKKVTVNLPIFGRETPVDIDFNKMETI